jgi:nickel transport protein
LLRIGLRIALLLPLISATAQAHQLKVFATVEGMQVVGSVYFAGGGAAPEANVLVTDDAGEVLARLEPDEEGHFRYQADAATVHRVIAETADGHRSEWRLSADDFSAGLAVMKAATDRSDDAQPLASDPTGQRQAAASRLDAEQLAALDLALARQIRPLREELMATRDALRLQDILGGIGYILGLAGLALWWRCRPLRRP